MKTLPGGLVVYETSDWGARPPRNEPDVTTPTHCVIHHMDWPNRAPATSHSEAVAKAFEVARNCQADHMDNNGWADTGQHFTVTIDGVVLEGRHHSLAALLAGTCVRGAHAADGSIDFNDSWGTEHEGTFEVVAPQSAQWDASVKLHAAICFLCKLDSGGSVSGKPVILGHRDTGISTECPGDVLDAKLAQFRSDVHALKVKLLHW